MPFNINWFDPDGGPMWLDYVGLGLTFIGFWIAFCQLRKTRSAMTAAKNSLNKTRNHLITNQFLAVATSFAVILSRLHTALDAKDRKSLSEELTKFSRKALTTAALIEEMKVEADEVRLRLIEAADDASRACHSLFSNPEAELHHLAGDALLSIQRVTPDLSALGTKVQNTPPVISEEE